MYFSERCRDLVQETNEINVLDFYVLNNTYDLDLISSYEKVSVYT